MSLKDLEEYLPCLGVGELKKLCTANGLPKSGLKKDLLAMLYEHVENGNQLKVPEVTTVDKEITNPRKKRRFWK